ncbi:MAG TPA: hypothetical protein DHV36_08585 [Desulfobacteraceae bacterium]|nr:hypothetical protein [Desulfobacteraceae bacterium]
MIPTDDATSPENKAATAAELKDYFCPFCNHKLFRGRVKEFKLVCQECNKLVDSSTLNQPPELPDKENQEPSV